MSDTPSDFFDVLENEWHAAFPAGDVTCEPLMTRMTWIVERMNRQVDYAFEPFGLGRGDVEVICAIVRSPDHRLQPKDLLGKMVVSSGGLTARIDKLEKRGALRRLPDPNDRRGSILEATPEGIRLALAVHAAHVALEEELVRTLGLTERAQLNGLLRRLVANMPNIEQNIKRNVDHSVDRRDPSAS